MKEFPDRRNADSLSALRAAIRFWDVSPLFVFLPARFLKNDKRTD
jgi:hypothetical protein